MRMPHKCRSSNRSCVYHNTFALGRNSRTGRPGSRRARGGQRNEQLPFIPPEDWYDPISSNHDSRYEVIVQSPGRGYRHVVTPAEIRDRLNRLPRQMIESLDVIQLSRMTRKKRSFPCYGMQWGTTLYLYPLEDSRVEYFDRSPNPAQFNEACMFGGRWDQDECGGWMLIWSEPAIKDFYLNNILIHELGHLLDNRNNNYVDRERFAEWFAIEYGYKPSRQSLRVKRVVRRHHVK